jgi:hypothetical protein
MRGRRHVAWGIGSLWLLTRSKSSFMSDALLIAIVATTIAGFIIGAVTWMLILPARAARLQDRVLPEGGPPTELVEQLLAQSGEVAGPCQAIGPPERASLRQEWTDLMDQGQTAQARRRAQVLWQLGDADPELAAQATESGLPPEGYGRLNDQRWISDLASPALDPGLTGIMALLGPEVITWHAHPSGQYGLSREQRVETLSAPPRISELAADVARVVGVAAPVMFITPEREARLIHVNLSVVGRYHTALAVGKVALQISDENVQRFMLGRKLTYMRPEHLLCTEVDGPEDLLGLHLTVAAVLRPSTLPPPPETVCGLPLELVEQRLREHFSDASRSEPMRRALAAVGTEVDVDRWAAWLVATEETSFRCGLLMAGDLLAALRILEMDDVKPGTDRETELCYNALYRFFVSSEYETLRQELAEPERVDSTPT